MKRHSIIAFMLIAVVASLLFAQQSDHDKNKIAERDSKVTTSQQKQASDSLSDSMVKQQAESSLKGVSQTKITTKEQLQAQYAVDEIRLAGDSSLYSIHGAIQLENQSGELQRDAITFLNEIAPLYGFQDVLSEYRIGRHYSDVVVFDQYVGEVPVNGSSIYVYSLKPNTITTVRGRFFPNIQINTIPTIDSEQAIQVAVDDIGTMTSNCIIVDTLLINLFNDEFHLMWWLGVYDTLKPPGYEYSVDAHTGEILEKIRIGVEFGKKSSTSE